MHERCSAAARRSRLDSRSKHGERPYAPLRDGRCTGGGYPPASGPSAGQRCAARTPLSSTQVVPPPPTGDGGNGHGFIVLIGSAIAIAMYLKAGREHAYAKALEDRQRLVEAQELFGARQYSDALAKLASLLESLTWDARRSCFMPSRSWRPGPRCCGCRA